MFSTKIRSFFGRLAVGALLLGFAATPLQANQSESVDTNFKRLKIAEGDFASIDPAECFDSGCIPVLESVCAKVMTLDANGVPTPEIAVDQPVLSNGDTTFTFQLRDDFNFSPPSNERVDAETVKQSLERALHPDYGLAAFFLFDIAGLDDYRDGLASEVSGIEADGHSLAITLEQPSGDFLSRFSLTFTCVVPKGTPVNELTEPYPSAGRYRIADYPVNPLADEPGEPDHTRLLLKRNPQHPSQTPDSGLARAEFDSVEYFTGLSDEEATGGVIDGIYDITSSLPDGSIADIFADYPDQAFTLDSGLIYFLSFNTGRWPLCNEHMRRALNFAFDRTETRDFVWGSPAIAQPSDQFIPLIVPGNLGAQGTVYPVVPGVADAQAERALFDADMASPDPSCAPPAGWSPGDEVEIVWPTITSSFYAAWIPLIDDNFAIIDVAIDQQISSSPSGQRNAGNFDVYLFGWLYDYIDPANYLNTFFTSASIYNYGFDVEGPAPGFDQRLQDAATIVDPVLRVATYTQLHEELVQTGAGLPFASVNSPYLKSLRLGCEEAGTLAEGLCLDDAPGAND